MNEVQNECRFIGRFGKDPELQYLPSGTAICKFSIAVDSTRKTNGEYENDAIWVDLTAFGKRAETITQLCKKGTLIAVVAEYGKNRYETSDGEKRIAHNFTVRNFKLLSGYRSREERSEEDKYLDDDLDNMPF